MNRIRLTPAQALEFAQLPSTIKGDGDLVDAALKVKANPSPGAYMYVGVTVSTPEGSDQVRVCVSKDVD